MNDLESTMPRKMSYHFLIKLADIAKWRVGWRLTLAESFPTVTAQLEAHQTECNWT